jgi:hypothetical protein
LNNKGLPRKLSVNTSFETVDIIPDKIALDKTIFCEFIGIFGKNANAFSSAKSIVIYLRKFMVYIL